MQGSALFTFAIYGGIIAMFYFFFIRPQNKQKKEIELMRNSIQKGDEIVTIGGINAKVVNVEGDNIIVEVKPNDTKMNIKKWAVRQLVEK
ncbi:preprotein translocase subunit YajC [Clostridiaceae bacterium HSG29]|nr:preprotein translocase subunit YajC [Clostridiaceae bacterium HSG29]